MQRETAKGTVEPNLFACDAQVEHLVDGSEIEVTGPLSVRTSAKVRSHLTTAIDSGEGDLLLKLDGAEVWDATGLGVLMGAHHRATRCGRRLVVVDASPRLCRLMRLTKLDRVIAQNDAQLVPARLAS